MISEPKSAQPVLTFDNVTLRLMGKSIFPDTCWEIQEGQNWAVIGPNGSGKSTLMRAIMGELPVYRGRIIRHTDQPPVRWAAYVSFERHRRIIDRELSQDHARHYSGNIDSFTTARDIIQSAAGSEPTEVPSLNRIAADLGIMDLLDRGIRFLSTGEIRKVLIARALYRSPQLLILDEPYEGLDAASRIRFTAMIEAMMHKKVQMILVTHRHNEIPPGISRILVIKQGKIEKQGPRGMLLNSQIEFSSEAAGIPPLAAFPALSRRPPLPSKTFSYADKLIDMQNVTVRYGNVTALNNLTWSMKQGENWAIQGPNGAGKSTLLSLIAADNTQAYAHNIYLFGKRRGSGESIWDIKQKIGIVSAEFQIRYQKEMQAWDVVISGFFDSVGLYRQATPDQKSRAFQWMESIGIASLQKRFFNRLSGGEQRLVLLARAMVKSPQLLILDEPCQGLDPLNRRRVLNLVDRIGSRTSTDLLYVTHHVDEMLPCISHILEFKAADDNTFNASVIAVNSDRNSEFTAAE